MRGFFLCAATSGMGTMDLTSFFLSLIDVLGVSRYNNKITIWSMGRILDARVCNWDRRGRYEHQGRPV